MYNLLPNHKVKTFQMPDGTEITLETGKLAKQAQGSVVLKVGKTMLLATMCYSKEAKEGVDFLPLTVDYQEKYAGLGRFPGGFFKREARSSEYEILISRLIDRAIRPLFPDDWHAEVQLQITLISGEKDVMPDAYAALAASAALIVSDIPFTGGPISEVRVAQVDGILKVNPTIAEISRATLDLMIAGSAKDIVMVEGEANEVSEELMLEALSLGHDAIKIQCQAQKELEALVGSTTKIEYSHEKNDLELKEKLYKLLYDKVYAHAKKCNANKSERSEGFKAIIKEYIAALPEDSTEDLGLVKKYYHDIEKDAARNLVLDDRIRLDGRKLDEVRPIWSEISYLPSAHGSAVFTRGETQSLTSVTLGTKLDEQTIDGAVISGSSKFNLHYNFPGFSTGEVKPNRGLGRREVGHGNLAQRSLKKVAPIEGEFPYTIRIVSDILESNGSSSMATVCAGSLALMDAGVPMRGGVSGIAMGLITDTKTGKYAVLSDILGDEDHLGDMDFKVAGTSKGITACQMDIKVDGLSYEVLKEALYQAKKGRAHILAEMNKTISEPKVELNANAPRIYTIKIDKDQIGAVIGPGGKVVQEIQKTTGATITIEEIDNKGVVNIFAVNKDALDAAVRRVKGIVAVPEIGEIYDGVVKSIQAYGAFVEFMPGKDGLLHISEIKWERVENMEGVLEVGETLKVKLMEVDPKTGKFRLSRKVLLPKPEAAAAQA